MSQEEVTNTEVAALIKARTLKTIIYDGELSQMESICHKATSRRQSDSSLRDVGSQAKSLVIMIQSY